MTTTHSSLRTLQGVGPRRADTLSAAGIHDVGDLYDYFPRRYLDRRAMRRISELLNGETVTVVGRVLRTVQEGQGGARSRFRVTLADETGVLELIWFRGVRYFSKMLAVGDVLAVFGKVGYFGRQAQMQHPDFDRLGSGVQTSGDAESSDLDLYHTGRIISLYSTSDAMKQAGLSSRQLRMILLKAFDDHPPGREENLSGELLAAHGLMPLGEAYREIHFPATQETLAAARYRLKWTELFYAQLLFALKRQEIRQNKTAARFDHSGEITRKLYEALPFDLTGAQKTVIREIYQDLRSGCPMNRLLQGDVGSGKTLVAMFSIALAADNGLQSAFMAPTEILAVQHYLALKRAFQPLGLNLGLLSGRQRKKERDAVLGDLRNGTIAIAVGTHAMIEEGVTMAALGLVIIDEQHRFGVLQRKALQEKALNPHVLLMTATPIPRTLCMGVFGDLDVSVINEMPPGRQPVVTKLLAGNETGEAYASIIREVQKGRQAYIVYPMVEESEKIDLKAAVDRFDFLKATIFSDLRLGLIHGRMTTESKESVMDEFRNGRIDVLVGTTVIEVGVDVPNATIMMIEHAERFGLAQLHQLRGRVGRGSHPSTCFLSYEKTAPDALRRLHAMESVADGFRISKIDAGIRGTGNILGKEQSGAASGLKIADLQHDEAILNAARTAAFALVAKDSQLRMPEHAMIRTYYLRHYHERYALADIG
jgi:ATP-dependent DNA helicase RecG